MSYDITYRVRCLENPDLWVDVGLIEANVTYNVRDMIRASTGLEWKNEEDNGLVKDVIPYIANGYAELEKYPEKYKQYESPNGWGTIEGCKRFFATCIKEWTDFCEDYTTRDFKDIVHFWLI